MAARAEGRTAEATRDATYPGSAAHPGPAADLTVVYDDRCPLCRRCRKWVMAQQQLVSYRFVPASEWWVRDWLGRLVPVGDELVVVGRNGATWVGPDAFIVCLWGLRRYRAMAEKLQLPGARAVAKRVFHMVSLGRGLVPGSECDERSCTP